MNKEINLFLVATAYQYISAINLCLEKYNQSSCENHIFYWEHGNLRGINVDAIANLNGFIKALDFNDKIKFSKNLAKYNCDRFIFFQENNILNKYIAYHQKKRGVKIYLGPDGTKPYGVFQKNHELLSMIKDTIKDYKYLISNKLFLGRIIPSRYYKYGSTYLLDNVLVQYKKLFNPSLNQKLCEISELPELTNKNVIIISNSFSRKIKNLNKISGNILYFNQPLWTDDLIRKELEIISEIVKIKPDKKVYIKLHPATPVATKKKYLENNDISIIDDRQPAEIYLAQLNNTICITGWSAAIMHKLGENNKFYYLYPLFEEVKDKILSQIHLIGFPHISVLKDMQDLKKQL